MSLPKSPPRVFLSYRSVDRERVRAIAEALLARGIDAWWDVWEIRPGDNFVAKINEGLERCECGAVFLSKASMEGAWHQDEISILKTYAVDEKRPLIPVLLDAGVKVPAALRIYSRVSADEIDALADAILQRIADKPPLGPALTTATRAQFSILLREVSQSVIGVSACLNGQLIAEHSISPGADFAFSYADFLRARPFAPRLEFPDAIGADRERDLVKLGDAVGKVVFTGDIGAQLGASLGREGPQELELVFESASSRLLSIPFEAARLADGRTPALIPGVFIWRREGREARATCERRSPSPGPLKILVAVGAPDEGKTPNSVLDSERELQTILNAVKRASELDNAYVRVLEIGSPDQIGVALRELGYHVLHLSGHGNRGVIELEDEDGSPVPTTAALLAEKIRDSGHAPPLVVLASCNGGVGSDQGASFAQALLDSGVPAVLAMQSAVSDAYCTDLTGKFYAGLSLAESPLPSRALALARRTLEEARGKSAERSAPEYATPSLFLRGEEQPVLNRSGEQTPVAIPARSASSGAVPLLAVGDLIGRRKEARQMARVLTDDPMSVSQIGRKSGCQVLGSGGVGKSTVAGRVMQRMADRGWPVATVSGKWGLATICDELAALLLDHPQQELAGLGKKLADAPEKLRPRILSTLLSGHRVLLVLDNFEDMLTPGGTGFLDPVAEQIFLLILQSCQHAKILVTSRYPVPGAETRLCRIDLGPLSAAETRKLMLRHEGLKRQPDANVKLIERAIGGHPRTLEYLDALLRSGIAQLATVQDRLERFAANTGISLHAAGPFDEKLRDAIRIAAADAMIAELVRLAGQHPGDLELLWRASVFPFAAPVEALAFDPAAPEAAVDVTRLAAPIRRLAATSLLTLQEGNRIYVHRWTAESLVPSMAAGVHRSSCLHAARYLREKPSGLAGLVESIRLFLTAEAFDDASALAASLIPGLQSHGQLMLATELAREIGEGLPDDHEDKLRFIVEEADGLRSLGFGNQALDRLRSVTSHAEQRVAQEPNRADYLRDLSVSYERMGDLERALGNGEAARRFFEKALEIAERLAAQEPNRADYLRDLSVSYNKMGDLERALGNGEAARRFFEKALEIAERLAAQEPNRADYLRDLSVSYNKMGDLERALGNGEAARRFFEKALEIAGAAGGAGAEPGRLSARSLGLLQQDGRSGACAGERGGRPPVLRKVLATAGAAGGAGAEPGRLSARSLGLLHQDRRSGACAGERGGRPPVLRKGSGNRRAAGGAGAEPV